MEIILYLYRTDYFETEWVKLTLTYNQPCCNKFQVGIVDLPQPSLFMLFHTRTEAYTYLLLEGFPQALPLRVPNKWFLCT